MRAERVGAGADGVGAEHLHLGLQPGAVFARAHDDRDAERPVAARVPVGGRDGVHPGQRPDPGAGARAAGSDDGLAVVSAVFGRGDRAEPAGRAHGSAGGRGSGDGRGGRRGGARDRGRVCAVRSGGRGPESRGLPYFSAKKQFTSQIT